MPWWVRDRGQTSTGKASGSGSQSAPDPHSLHFPQGPHGRQPTSIQDKAQSREIERAANPGRINAGGGDRQPGQHGCGHYRLGRGIAHAAGNQAFLKEALRVS
jgi:hypothetical protein